MHAGKKKKNTHKNKINLINVVNLFFSTMTALLKTMFTALKYIKIIYLVMCFHLAQSIGRRGPLFLY